MQRIVVGVDGSQASRRALRWAADEARRRQAILDVVHAWHMPFVGVDPYLAGYASQGLIEQDAAAVLDQDLAAADLRGVPEVERILVRDGAARALLDGLLLGSVSQQVSLHAGCPVAITPGP